VLILPNVKKFGFGIGVAVAAALCSAANGQNFDGKWSTLRCIQSVV